jgi:hypothetical protein
MGTPLILRDYQIRIANEAVSKLKEYGLVYLAMQVRCGKTLTSMYAAISYGAENILFITKKKVISDIQYQWDNMVLPEDAPGFYDIEIINYEQLHKYDRVPCLIICDEAQCLAQYPVPSNKAKLLKKIANGKPIIFLSGTPTAESYSQIYHQLWTSTFSPFAQYPSFYKWVKAGYVTVTKKYLFNREINDYARADKVRIDNETKHLFISFSQEDAGFSEYVDEEVLTVKMSDKTYRIADKLIKHRIVESKNGDVILADTAVKLQQKLHQIYSGTVITEGGEYKVIDTTKAEFIRDRFYGQKIAIFYKFKSELATLGIMSHLTDSVEEFNTTDKWFTSQIQSGREGINLSKADALVMYNIDFSAVSYWQARARLQTKDRTTPAKVYWIFSEGGIEHKIYEAVQQKKDYTLSYFKKDYLSKIAGAVPKSVSKRS